MQRGEVVGGERRDEERRDEQLGPHDAERQRPRRLGARALRDRADLLEPALAARPGRIDQAVELPLPDADGRRRLLALYGEGLDLQLDAGDPLIADLDGVSPAFIRELLRRAAVVCAERSDGALRVKPEHLRAALSELREGAGELTNTLLGSRQRPA